MPHRSTSDHEGVSAQPSSPSHSNAGMLHHVESSSPDLGEVFPSAASPRSLLNGDTRTDAYLAFEEETKGGLASALGSGGVHHASQHIRPVIDDTADDVPLPVPPSDGKYLKGAYVARETRGSSGLLTSDLALRDSQTELVPTGQELQGGSLICQTLSQSSSSHKCDGGEAPPTTSAESADDATTWSGAAQSQHTTAGDCGAAEQRSAQCPAVITGSSPSASTHSGGPHDHWKRLQWCEESGEMKGNDTDDNAELSQTEDKPESSMQSESKDDLAGGHKRVRLAPLLQQHCDTDYLLNVNDGLEPKKGGELVGPPATVSLYSSTARSVASSKKGRDLDDADSHSSPLLASCTSEHDDHTILPNPAEDGGSKIYSMDDACDALIASRASPFQSNVAVNDSNASIWAAAEQPERQLQPATPSDAGQALQQTNDLAGEEADLWNEPMLSVARKVPTGSSALASQRHVHLADPPVTQIVEIPSTQWADDDFFFPPDYAHMHYKQRADEDDGLIKVELNNGSSEEEEAMLSSIPCFRFQHRSASTQVSSPQRSMSTNLLASEWSSRPSGENASQRKGIMRNDFPPATELSPLNLFQESASPLKAQTLDGNAEEEDSGATVERTPRVFFTKERLASRAALIQSRRTSWRGMASTAAAAITSIATPPSASPLSSVSYEALSLPLDPKASALRSTSSDKGLRIRLPSLPPPSVTSAALALPVFAASISTAKSPRREADSSLRSSVPRRLTSPEGGEKDDEFGGWVQPPQSVAPLSSLAFTGAAPLRGHPAPLTVSIPGVQGILRDVFDNTMTHRTRDASPLTSTSDAQSSDRPLSVQRCARLSTPHTSLPPVKRLLEALSFTSLSGSASKVYHVRCSDTVSSHPPSVGETPSSPVEGENIGAALLKGSGYVVPWQTRTSASPVIRRESPDFGSSDAAPTRGNEGSPAAEAPEIAHSWAFPDGSENAEDVSMRMTRRLLFPHGAFQSKPPCTPEEGTASSLPILHVASLLGGRSLPYAPKVTQWSVRDVLLAVHQEQRRMAQESDKGIETERLEDVLRRSSV